MHINFDFRQVKHPFVSSGAGLEEDLAWYHGLQQKFFRAVVPSGFNAAAVLPAQSELLASSLAAKPNAQSALKLRTAWLQTRAQLLATCPVCMTALQAQVEVVKACDTHLSSSVVVLLRRARKAARSRWQETVSSFANAINKVRL